uniref:Predicted protein n=1 Tax=Hordeum vulgare subsp. vulgare TaxID=112509 RepID=F2DJS7_HORVV|nr:predicted protein [Hordeum vulgare subsp. vulgare]
MPRSQEVRILHAAPAMDQAASYSTPLLLVLGSVTLAVSLFVLIGRSSHGRGKAGLPPGPPALLFLVKFVALRRSIFDLGPLLRDLHARHGPVISVRLFRTLVFVADRKLAHRALVQGGATFADRPPPVDPVRLFTSGGRDISSSSYGPYWRLVRRNLAGEALSPARVGLFAPARRWACDGLVSSLLSEQQRQRQDAVTLRPLLRRAMFELLVYMCFGARLGREALDEVEELQHQALLSVTTFPVFAFFPAVTKRLFGRRWAACLAVRRRQDEIFVPLIHAKRGDGNTPCYADSLLAVRVADEGGRQLTDAEMVALCSEFMNGGTDTTVTLLEWIMAELVQTSRRTGQGLRGGESQSRAQRPAGDAVPKGRRARGPSAAPARPLPPPARRAERRGGDRELRGAQGSGGQLPAGRDWPRRDGVDGGAGVPAGEVPGGRRGARSGHHGEQGDQDDAFRRGPQDVPGVHAGHAPRRVLRGENGEGAGVAVCSGGGEGGHGRDARFHHRDEAPAPCAHPLQKLTISHTECNLSTYMESKKHTWTQPFCCVQNYLNFHLYCTNV